VGPFSSKYKTITINAKPYDLNTLGCKNKGGGRNFSKVKQLVAKWMTETVILWFSCRTGRILEMHDLFAKIFFGY